MIISRTPFRVSLFGGGSDYPKWYREHGGAVLGFAINKYCYISIRPLPPFFEHRHRIVYSVVENVSEIKKLMLGLKFTMTVIFPHVQASGPPLLSPLEC
jgi:D-glycero-alpha-D-manno-heptose-7-phosphate kinase